MYCLFLDIASSQSLCSLFFNGRVVEEICSDTISSRHPCAIWQILLDRHNVNLDQIHFFACGVGPGSYTGIRTAVATVKSLSLVMKKPIVAVSSLLLLSPVADGQYVLLADGGFSGAYMQKVSVSATGIVVEPPQIMSLNAVPDDFFIVTDALEWIEKRGLCIPKQAEELGLDLSQSSRDSTIKNGSIFEYWFSPKLQCRHGAMVARYCYQEAAAERVYSATTLPVWYLRKTQAEIERELQYKNALPCCEISL